MSMFVVILKKIVSFLRLIASTVKRVLCCFGRNRGSHIGELPFVLPSEQRLPVVGAGDLGYNPPGQQQTAQSWNTWNDNEFGVQSKIDEYRQRRAEALQSTSSIPNQDEQAEPDFFDDMKPKLKAAKKLLLKQNNAEEETSTRRNLFDFRENEVFVPPTATAELGDLDLDAGSSEDWAGQAASWGDSDLDVERIDQALRDQKQKERAERQRQRLQEHERRLQDKRRHLNSGSSQ